VTDKNFALAGYDRTHVFQMGFVYELPFAKNSNNMLGAIVKNWQINGIGSAYSGTPFTINGTNPGLNCPGCGLVVINVNGDPKPTGSAGSSTEPWYDKSLFSQPTAQRCRFRNSAQPVPHLPVWNVDLGLFRSFPATSVRRSVSKPRTCSTTRTGDVRIPPSRTTRS
jgi:hypothetical protein